MQRIRPASPLEAVGRGDLVLAGTYNPLVVHRAFRWDLLCQPRQQRWLDLGRRHQHEYPNQSDRAIRFDDGERDDKKVPRAVLVARRPS